ncbi:DUF3857 domain-containing protein [Portibacter lacus]|uniref:DUF3857 domain-containing protein n=1 Tax=Portibacter lacus TaxID=1099794 RepID=A0AA37SRT2_9BACT|nr:DUF3857 domain-containing protein [Portibacter lacus]GLR17661.1 hypothetical protein GCM10007940_22760 [Portibacter lacus]
MKQVLLYIFLFNVCGFSSEVDPVSNTYENANDVVLEEKIEYAVLSKKKAIKTTYKKILILSEDSDDTGYAVGFNDLIKVKNLNVSIFDADGKRLEKYKKKDFHDLPTPSNELYSDSRSLSLSFEKFNPPYIIEIESEVEYDGMQVYDHYYPNQYNQAVVKSSYIISYPSDLKIRYRGYNGMMDPKEKTLDNKKALVWEVENLPALKYEPLGPSGYRVFPLVKIYPTQFYFDGYEGSQETWETYNDFYYQLNVDRDQLSPEMAAKVKQLTEDKDDEFSKIDALYTYLKENMRYISVQLGIGGWQTFDAAYVEHNKFGDCKALSNFMGAMLSEIGVENNKVIIKRGEEVYNPLSEEFVDAGLFNHAILYVPSQDMFVECTSNNYPLGYLGNDNANKKVMISTASGPIFKHTPKMGKDENTKHISTSIELLESGGAHIKSVSTYEGYRHDYYRTVLPMMTQEEKEKSFQRSYPVGIQKLFSYEDDIIDGEPKLQTKYELEVSQYGSRAGKRLFIPLDGVNSELSVPSSVEERKLNFYSIVEETVEHEITIIIPDDYEIEALPNENFDEDTVYGSFRLSISKEDDAIKVYKKWVSKIFEFPPEKYNEYREKMKTFSSLDNSKIVLVKKKT